MSADVPEDVQETVASAPPGAEDDPEWVVVETGVDPLRHRVTETLFTLGGGGIGTRGSVEEASPGSLPLVLLAGVYAGTGAEQHLLTGPDWTGLRLEPPPREDRRVLDLRAGLLRREAVLGGAGAELRTLRFASAARPGVVALRATGPASHLRPGPALRPPPEGAVDTRRRGDRLRMRVRENPAGPVRIEGAAWQRSEVRDGHRSVERIAVLGTAGSPLDAALDAAVTSGFDELLAEHRATWAERWRTVDVDLPDDPEAQLALRFALFQLWTNVDGRDEAAVGARGVSGAGYRGHVFWDADVHVLPAVVTLDPAAARAVLEYRLRRLPAARAAAEDLGRRGARFPWESGADGRDVTPTRGDLGGVEVPILTGSLEEHITADVAWAAHHYATWTGDDAFLAGPGAALLTETARYWASRCRLDASGAAHVDGVIGPDEYHERVDDNAYTNVLARWNLRRGADAAERTAGGTAETRAWRALADRLVDGYHPETGRYEQFRGYDALEPLLVTDVARPPVAADVLLGRERVAQSQVIKQPDVLMLHHLVPEELVPGSLAADVDFYGPRTAHGSSLSPAISAAVLARAGRPDEALELLRLALSVDLADLTGTTAAGLHLATLGGVWQAVVAGFAGVRVQGGVLHVDPVLPAAWSRLRLRFRCLGRRVRLDVDRAAVRVELDGPLLVAIARDAPVLVTHVARTSRGRRSTRRPEGSTS